MSRATGTGGGRSASRQLIGRDGVLARLDSLLDEGVASQRLTSVLVEGAAGIGKTRLIQEWTAGLRDHDIEVLVGHCVAQAGDTLPYAPLVEILTELVRREGPTAVRRWAGAAGAELGRLVPVLADEGTPPTPDGTGRLFAALSSLLTNLSFRRPLLLVVEDVHWADTSTRELLAVLGRQQRGSVLLLLTVRSDETPVPSGLGRYVAELARGGAARISLSPLTRSEQARQVSDIMGVPPTRDLLEQVYSRAEGNPFFAEELLALGKQEQHALPVTVRDLLLARLEALQPSTRQLLRAASVIGREVPYRLLEAVVDVHGDRLDKALFEAVEAHVLEPGTQALTFRHALLQEAILGSQLPGEAVRSHRRVAVALTQDPRLVGARSQGVAGRVARHWDAAGEPAKALVASVAAGTEAWDALAFAESLFHYERALELVDVVPEGAASLPVERALLLRWAAEVAHLTAHADRATELIREAMTHADRDDDALHGWLHERLGRYLWMAGDGLGALAAYEEAVKLVPADPPSRARAAVLSGLSQILMLADRHEESAVLAREAIDVARQVPDGRSIEGRARNNLGVDLAFTGHLEDGLAELNAARRIADEELADVDENARALVNLNSTLLLAGRLEEAAEVALESVRASDALGLRRRKGIWCRCDAAHTLMLLGRYDEAAELLAEARGVDPQGVNAFRMDLVEGQLLIRQGEVERARDLLEQARRASDLLLDPQLTGPLYAALVELTCWQEDDAATAAELVDEVLSRLDLDAVHPVVTLEIASAAVRAAARAGGDTETTAAWLARARIRVDGTPGPLPEPWAHLATAEAEVADTPAAWRLAVDRWVAFGDTFRTTYARLRLAGALLAAGADRAEAAEQLTEADRTARELGAAGLVSACEALARRSRLRVEAAPADNPYRLTRREREVLGLVAEGLTDRAVGGRLFISHRTVERHVSNLLAKLGADRRSELVATAHREGLLDDGDEPGGG